MKTKVLLSIIALSIIVSAFGQNTIELTFTAENNGQYVPLDSIFIENLTQGGDTTLYASDTVLVLDYVSSIGDKEITDKNTFSVSQNYPNPFTGKTEVDLYLPKRDAIKITVRNILGRQLAHYKNTLERGNHAFSFYPGNGKYYLLTVTGKQTSQTIKMLNAGKHTTNGKKCKIAYTGSWGNVIGFKSQQAINDFGLNLGDSLQYTGYANSVDGIFGSAVAQHKPQEDTIYLFDILKGLRCPGTPTVTDIDSNTYNTVQIGTQCWMKENLKATTYQNGTPIPNVTDAAVWSNLTTDAYVWNDNDISWKDLYGALYNWHTTVDTNGLCPTGWHVPTNDEWTALTNFIGGTGTPHGNELKSCRQANSPLGGGCNTTEHPRWNENEYNYDWGTDNYGFSCLPGGARSDNGYFDNVGRHGLWWSSTKGSLDSAWHRLLGHYDGDINVLNYNMQCGYSVRCLRDF